MSNEHAKILWADDEIDLLKPHIIFLENKGYRVTAVSSGLEAIDEISASDFDAVFLDENMPGISGLEVLSRIKAIKPATPVIMITKSEEETIMEDAIGSKISDYLIKPVNPHQILLSLKKNLDSKRLVSEKTTSGYQQEFRQIGMRLNDQLDWEEWSELYKQIVYWDLELEQSGDPSMREILSMQKDEANNQFCRFFEENYIDWLSGREASKPEMSHTIFKNWVLPEIKDDKPLFLVVIDNLRYDQWRVIQHALTDDFRVDDERTYFSILPTATQYARNALFAGLLPGEIEKRFPQYWKGEEEDGSKNQFENELLTEQIKRLGRNFDHSYAKITNLNFGKKVAESIHSLSKNSLNVIVYNFVDMLSHARTEMEVIRELADDESAYRSLTLSWFEHSPLRDMMKSIADMGAKMIITTDHGTMHVKHPIKVVGDRNTNTNLRYKIGRNLNYKEKEVFEVLKPEDAFLPRANVSSRYIFAQGNDFFAYPNNYNHYVKYYRDTFQHGGVSLEEVIIPFAICSPK
ncbi:MAG: PglZ domain-containing protein [Flavobacteriales bacterium]|nr:PglZ domain-containing protein [Flavobacteriales bacterium]